MQVFETINALQKELSQLNSKSIGLVPTMGALHRGHLSLMNQSLEDNDITVVSVFVNPTQFNDKNDLEKYPRTLDKDTQLVNSLGVDYVFAPTVEEMYPEPDTRVFNYSPQDEVMEGIYRPGHFNGMCQIVSKLFSIVQPTRAYFGEKDYQQLVIVKRMVEDLKLDIEVVGCPIVREKDGLALSSRNALLSKEERENALLISKTLFESLKLAANYSLKETLSFVKNTIQQNDNLELQYFEIVDANTLLPLEEWEDSSSIIGCITVFCGAVRLIDNIKYKG
ncbi:MAG: pantoate--beta-alanine ligase [Bacteroides sp.]|nr:pantoate--beta-alanine ligase [Bacteroides sp.]MDD4719273.1 pantoate--beta-alanine ligase [Bacteroides sp.]NLI64591.1 pantoate--beta-alanine ligase [Bacteroidales bacterium]